MIGSALAIIGGVLIVIAATSPSMSESAQNALYGAGGTLFILFAVAFLIVMFLSAIDFIKLLSHHVIFASVFFAVVVVGSGTTYLVIKTAPKYNENFSESITLLQNNLAELEAVKIQGDKNPSSPEQMQKIQIMSGLVTDRLETISVPKELTAYKETIVQRGKDISEATKDPESWSALPSRSDDYQIKLSKKEAEEVLKASINMIAELKEFGDTAIQRNDTETMKYIAAKLLIQTSLMNEVAKNLGTEDVCMGAGGVSTGPIGTGENKGGVWCVQETVQATNEVATTAINYINGDESAKDAWNNSWQNVQSILGTGITLGEPDQSGKLSPTVQAFYDECTSKGGIVGGAGTVKTGLPTTEFGYTCEYKYNSADFGQQTCWDYLTYSGGRFMGGNSGCPTENLLPIIEFEAEPSAENPSAAKWDGAYPISTTVYCSTDLPGMPTVFPVNTTITVSNSVGNDDGTTFSINNDGIGTEIQQYNSQGENYSVTMYGIINYQFYLEGSLAKLNAIANLNGSALIDGQIYTINCSGTASAVRQ